MKHVSFRLRLLFPDLKQLFFQEKSLFKIRLPIIRCFKIFVSYHSPLIKLFSSCNIRGSWGGDISHKSPKIMSTSIAKTGNISPAGSYC